MLSLIQSNKIIQSYKYYELFKPWELCQFAQEDVTIFV